MPITQADMTASKATHCGMCHVDFLGTGLCPAGKEHGFAAYWPDGRMELYKALQSKRVPLNARALDIIDSCTLCGRCDRQCGFITNLRPTVVAKALKELAKGYNSKAQPQGMADEVLVDLEKVVGKKYASNDPAVLCAYFETSHVGHSMSRLYAVVPRTAEEIGDVVKIANRHHLPYLPRGNGTFLSVGQKTMLAGPLGLDHGIIIDTSRMKTLTVDPVKKTATVQAGVNSYELQQAAGAVGLRASTGESEALICSNIASHGIISLWGNRYGWGADLYTDAEMVDSKGTLHHHSATGHDILGLPPKGPASLTLKPSHIVTEVTCTLHPREPDERAVFVPFEHLEDAVDFARMLAVDKVGLSLAVLSSKYFSEFLCPTNEIAQDFEYVMRKHLKTPYVVDIIGTKRDYDLIRRKASVLIDEEMMRTFFLASPKLASLKDHPFLQALESEPLPLSRIINGPLTDMMMQVLNPSAEQVATTYPKDLQGFFRSLYQRPEIADPVWLHTHRILPSRLLRQHMFMIRGGFLKADPALILKAHAVLASAGSKHKLTNALGFISFFDEGRLAFIEYDYYYDHTDPRQIERLNAAVVESFIAECSLDNYIPLEYVLHKGMYRKEDVFYPFPKALTQIELEQLQAMIHGLVEGPAES